MQNTCVQYASRAKNICNKPIVQLEPHQRLILVRSLKGLRGLYLKDCRGLYLTVKLLGA